MPLEALFHRASRARGARVFHPRGISFHATWQPEPQTNVFDGSPLVAGPAAAVVRISHGIGLPSTWPDLLGLAIKLVDLHGTDRDQDLLLASTGSGTVGRRVLRPARDLTRVTFSTILPYRIGRSGTQAPVVAHVGPTANTATFDEILRGGPNAVPLFNVYLGGVQGPRVARLTCTETIAPELADHLRYDPWNTGPELRPVGRLNELRRPTYAASQEGRGDADDRDFRHGTRVIARERTRPVRDPGIPDTDH